MEITRETDYAIRCILRMSRNPDAILMVEQISEEMAIPRSFLAKILQKLSKADIVKSFRGVRGGFRLSRGPESISILDVVEAIEGRVAMNECAVDASSCSLASTCCVHPVWVSLRRKVETHLGEANFGDLLRGSRRRAKK